MRKVESIKTYQHYYLFQTINYIENTALGTKINTHLTEKYYKESSIYIINYICLAHLKSYKSYKEAIKKIFNYHYNIPLILNENIILIPTENIQSYNNKWINISNVKLITKVSNDETKLMFKNGLEYTFNISTDKINTYTKRIDKILQYYLKIK